MVNVLGENAIFVQKNLKSVRKDSILYRVFDLYWDGFCNMRIGRTLWVVILVKLFVIFVVLKLFFFPNFLRKHAEEGKEADYVASQILK